MQRKRKHCKALSMDGNAVTTMMLASGWDSWTSLSTADESRPGIT